MRLALASFRVYFSVGTGVPEFQVVLSGGLGDSCEKAGLTACALFALSGPRDKGSKSAKAGLRLPVGKLQRWLLDEDGAGVAVLDAAAVFTAAVLECILEELVMAAVPRGPDGRPANDGGEMLTSEVLERVIGEMPEFWGLLQPYAHLINSRTSSGRCRPRLCPCILESRNGFRDAVPAEHVGAREPACLFLQRTLERLPSCQWFGLLRGVQAV